MQTKKKRFNTLSLVFGSSGLILQFLPPALFDSAQNSLLINGAYLLGICLLIVGFGFYAKSKNRSGWWGLLGLLSFVGLIALALLKDRSVDESANH